MSQLVWDGATPSVAGATTSESWATPSESWTTPSESLATPSESWATPSESWATPSESWATPSESWATPSESWATTYLFCVFLSVSGVGLGLHQIRVVAAHHCKLFIDALHSFRSLRCCMTPVTISPYSFKIITGSVCLSTPPNRPALTVRTRL